MNSIISESLARCLSAKEYIGRAAGCVHEIREKVNGVNKRYPASRVVFENANERVCEIGDYRDLIPNSNTASILYFDDLGAKLVNKLGRREMWKGELRLICWINTKKTEYTPEEILNDVLDNIPEDIPQTGRIHGGKIKVDYVEPKRPSPFSKYTYDEERRQYLTHPYHYFSLRLHYTTVGAKGCNSETNNNIFIIDISKIGQSKIKA